MKCPTDQTVLQLAERQGIEIDYCPSCRGVWLDRGELDKIIDRVADEDSSDRGDTRRAARAVDDARRDRYDDDDRHERVADRGRKKRKRGGFLGELFEFGD